MFKQDSEINEAFKKGTDWEKTFAIRLTDRELISKTYKKLQQIRSKKKLKMAKICIGNSHRDKCSISLIIK